MTGWRGTVDLALISLPAIVGVPEQVPKPVVFKVERTSSDVSWIKEHLFRLKAILVIMRGR